MRERPSGMIRLMTALLCVATLIGSGAASADGCQTPAPRANLSFVLKDVAGRDVSLSAFAGRVILLNFWATWCAPCRVEIPGLVRLMSDYERRGLTVLGISIDDSPAKLPPFMERLGMIYPVLVGRDHDRLQDLYGPRAGVPRSFLIARDGTVCRRYIGLVEHDVLERQIRLLL
jgi:cytochrome c biogenesis protein CcmG, thiol:disulfide interchange protein DsbE